MFLKRMEAKTVNRVIRRPGPATRRRTILKKPPPPRWCSHCLPRRMSPNRRQTRGSLASTPRREDRRCHEYRFQARQQRRAQLSWCKQRSSSRQRFLLSRQERAVWSQSILQSRQPRLIVRCKMRRPTARLWRHPSWGYPKRQNPSWRYLRWRCPFLSWNLRRLRRRPRDWIIQGIPTLINWCLPLRLLARPVRLRNQR